MSPSPPELLSVVIPTRNNPALLSACLRSLVANHDPALEILVVNDGGTGDLAAELREPFPTVQVISRELSGGFTVAANLGLQATRGGLLLLLNDDTEIDANALGALRQAFERDAVLGIVGGRLRYPDGRPQWSGGPEPSLLWLFGLASGLPAWLGRFAWFRRARPVAGTGGGEVGWVPGAAMAFRRQVWQKLGPLEEGYELYAQDLDFCSRARRASWRVTVEPGFSVIHHLGATIGQQEGSTGGQQTSLLFTDLLRWAARHRGEGWSERARWVMRLGLLLRRGERAADRAANRAAYRAAGEALARTRE